MISKRTSKDIFYIIIILLIMIRYVGLKYVINVFFQSLRTINLFCVQLYNTSILKIIFKYYITFPIIGVIIMGFGITNKKIKSLIGKILYFIIGYLIGFLLNFMASIII